MIKWDGFLKYSKLYLFGLLISCFTFLGGSIVNGLGAYTTVGIDSSLSAVNSNYDITFLKGGGLLTNYIGQGKGILALDNKVLFWWLPDGLPYFYTTGHSVQGYFPKFYYCSSLSSGGSYQEPSNCTENSIDENTTPLLKNFFNTVKAGDVVYYNFRNDGGTYWWLGFKICWDSSEIGHSMCFDTMYNYNGNASVQGKQLINSRGYSNLSFANLPYSEIGYAPGQNGYGGNYGGSSDGSTTVNYNDLTGDYVYVPCTVGQIINYSISAGLTENFCYGGLDNWDLYTVTGNYNIVLGSGKTLKNIWGYTNNNKNFVDWFNYWNTSYVNPNVVNPSIWLSEPAVLRSYFSIYNQLGGSQFGPELVYNFCELLEYEDRGEIYRGKYFAKTCRYIQDNSISQTYEDVSQGGIPVGTNWNGVGTIGSGIVGTGTTGENVKDTITFIQDFFNKAKSVIPTNFNGSYVGFIPGYIIAFMLALILFRFLRH